MTSARYSSGQDKNKLLFRSKGDFGYTKSLQKREIKDLAMAVAVKLL